MAFEQIEIEQPLQYSTTGWPGEQDSAGLAQTHLISDGDEIIVLVELNDLGFHTNLKYSMSGRLIFLYMFLYPGVYI
jgi:hypothetical protein